MPHVPAVASILKDEFIVVRAALIIPLSKAAIKTPINNVINPNVTLESFVFSAIYTTSFFNSNFICIILRYDKKISHNRWLIFYIRRFVSLLYSFFRLSSRESLTIYIAFISIGHLHINL